MARKLEDITGKKFGRLTAIGGYRRQDDVTYWDFRCDCGVIKALAVRNVKNGRVSSCGCYRVEASSSRVFTHGFSGGKHVSEKSRTYSAWGNMIQRCTNDSIECYEGYGGRGIMVCDRWMKFENFLEDMGECPVGLSIDRIDNDGNYEPGNCRWATTHEQLMNRRNTIRLNFRGELTDLISLSREFSVDYGTLLYRYKNGWDMELAVSTPVKRRVRCLNRVNHK